MSTPLSAEAQKELIALFARQFGESIEAVTKSKEVSKEFYLVPTEIQEETGETQQKIAWVAAALLVSALVKKGYPDAELDDETVKKLHRNALKTAYKRVKNNG